MQNFRIGTKGGGLYSMAFNISVSMMAVR